MKKSITSLALLVSATSAHALPPPQNPNAPKPKIVISCLDINSVEKDGSLYIGTCNESENNKTLNKKLNGNGCADDQVAIRTLDKSPVAACMPVGAVQL